MEKGLFEKLETIRNEYQAYLDTINKRNASRIEGSIRIQICKNGTVHYYHRKNKTEKYISKQEEFKVRELLQKRYDRLVENALKREIHAISYTLENSSFDVFNDAYYKIKPECRDLFSPIEEPFEVYSKEWLKIEYDGNPTPKNNKFLKTERGEIVRSKSELIIANSLYRHEIPYKYEYPFRVNKYKAFYPDFTILCKNSRKQIYWEHCGLISNSEYREHFLNKLKTYSECGITTVDNLILTFEDDNMPLGTEEVSVIIKKLKKM